MSSFAELSVAALALSAAERLNLMLLLGESLREPVGAPKPRKSKSKAKAAAEAESEGEAEVKPKRVPSEGQRKWQDGLAVVRAHMKALEFSGGKHAMTVGKALKEKASWPNPTEEEVKAAVEELVPEDERYSTASKPTKKTAGSKTKKAAKAAPKEEAEAESEDELEEAVPAAAGGGGAAEAEAEEEVLAIKQWKGDIGKGEQEYERLDAEGVSYIWEVKGSKRKYLGALKTKKDGTYTVDKKVAEPELDEE